MNIREVARRANVGIGTVSRVLNGHPSVSPEVQERVLKVIKELNYVPNVHAQRMWKGRTNTICFILANREVLYSLHAHIIRGVEEFCSINHYSVIFTTFKYSPETPADQLEVPPILRGKGVVDGVVLGGVNYSNFLSWVQTAGIPCVLFGNNLMDGEEAKSNAVSFDDHEGAEQATEYLIRLGHRNIWFIGDISWIWNRRRYEAYQRVMERRGLKPRSVTQGLAQSGHPLGVRGMRRILESGEPCTAVFAGSDYIAAGVMEHAMEKGLRVPDDLSLIGFDALDEFQYCRPRLTSVGTKTEKIGEYCALLLMRQIETGTEQPSVRIPMMLVEGATCAPPHQSTDKQSLAAV
jgi:DNA-binding LacI/PurR family transcriptional regulator